MVALIASSCAGGPCTGGKGEAASWVSLAGQVAVCKCQARVQCSPSLPPVRLVALPAHVPVERAAGSGPAKVAEEARLEHIILHHQVAYALLLCIRS